MKKPKAKRKPASTKGGYVAPLASSTNDFNYTPKKQQARQALGNNTFNRNNVQRDIMARYGQPTTPYVGNTNASSKSHEEMLQYLGVQPYKPNGTVKHPNNVNTLRKLNATLAQPRQPQKLTRANNAKKVQEEVKPQSPKQPQRPMPRYNTTRRNHNAAVVFHNGKKQQVGVITRGSNNNNRVYVPYASTSPSNTAGAVPAARRTIVNTLKNTGRKIMGYFKKDDGNTRTLGQRMKNTLFGRKKPDGNTTP